MKLTEKTSSHSTVIRNDKNLIMVQPTLAVATKVLQVLFNQTIRFAYICNYISHPPIGWVKGQSHLQIQTSQGCLFLKISFNI